MSYKSEPLVSMINRQMFGVDGAISDKNATIKNLRRWLTVCIVGWSITLLAGLAFLWSVRSIAVLPNFGSVYQEIRNDNN